MRGDPTPAPSETPGRASTIWQRRIGLVCAGLVTGLLICEVAARTIYPAPPDPGREPPILYRADVELGFTHVPRQRGWVDDGLVTINELGFRGLQPAAPKPAGSFRILAIGDSTTFGWGVDDAGTYPAALERELQTACPSLRAHVINAGVSGYNLDQQARLIRQMLPALAPDLLLVGVYWNDLPYHRITPDGAPAASPELADNGAPPNRDDFRLGNNPSRLNRLLRSSRLLYVLRHAWLGAISETRQASNEVRWERALLEGRRHAVIDRAWDAVSQALRDIDAFAREHGTPVGIVAVPIRAQVERAYPHAAYQTRVRAIAEDLALPFIDPLPELVGGRAPEQLFIPFDRVHFSAEGNAALAAAIAGILRAGPLVDCAIGQSTSRSESPHASHAP